MLQRIGRNAELAGFGGAHPLALDDARLSAWRSENNLGVGKPAMTGAELALRDAPPQPTQLPLAEASARELVNLGQALPLPVWMGSRPCTADMLPVMGPAPRHPGLWFNFGHAHQGFTLGPVAGRLLAEMVAGERSWIDPAPYAPARFG